MTTRQLIHNEIKKANRRKKWIESGSDKNIYAKQSQALLDEFMEKTSMLTNVSSGSIRIGALRAEDEKMFLNALERFNENPLTTATGQKTVVIQSDYEAFKEEYGEISQKDYITLVSVFESDTFQKFKENFGTYSNVIAEMAKDPKSYKKAISMLAGVNRSDKANGKYATNGELNVKAFIDRWREL